MSHVTCYRADVCVTATSHNNSITNIIYRITIIFLIVLAHDNYTLFFTVNKEEIVTL